ncbi:MAG: ABC transporter permease subunit [Oscillospiraceae bacterium]|nr:ABC transporter permease subunit [Oscillospiraceae bacterium]
MIGRTSRFNQYKKRLFKLIPLYVMLIVPVAYVLIFCYYPMYGAQIAFRDYKTNLGITGSPWVGMKNFITFFTSRNFLRILSNTLTLSIYYLIANTLVVVILSLLIHSLDGSRFYKKMVQTVIYLPHFISMVVIVGIVLRMLNPHLGILSRAIQAFGGTDRDLMGVSPAFPHIYVWSGIWQSAGWGTIIYLAALASAGTELHEAAMIDGASRFRRLLHIDIPTIMPTIVIILIMNMGTIIDIGYEKILLMQNSLNLSASEVISTYVYKMGIANNIPDYSLSTAVGLFNSVVSLFLVVTVNQIAKKVSETSLW